MKKIPEQTFKTLATTTGMADNSFLMDIFILLKHKIGDFSYSSAGFFKRNLDIALASLMVKHKIYRSCTEIFFTDLVLYSNRSILIMNFFS